MSTYSHSSARYGKQGNLTLQSSSLLLKVYCDW